MSCSNRLKYSYCLQARRGSATVEAALLYPLVILILAFMIRQSLSLYDGIVCTSIRHAEEIQCDQGSPLADPWSLLRAGHLYGGEKDQ